MYRKKLTDSPDVVYKVYTYAVYMLTYKHLHTYTCISRTVTYTGKEHFELNFDWICPLNYHYNVMWCNKTNRSYTATCISALFRHFQWTAPDQVMFWVSAWNRLKTSCAEFWILLKTLSSINEQRRVSAEGRNSRRAATKNYFNDQSSVSRAMKPRPQVHSNAFATKIGEF